MFAFLLIAAVIDVGDQKQLFIDHKFIESSEGITLTVQQPMQLREKLEQNVSETGRSDPRATPIVEISRRISVDS